jgi:hypothetical protein
MFQLTVKAMLGIKSHFIIQYSMLCFSMSRAWCPVNFLIFFLLFAACWRRATLKIQYSFLGSSFAIKRDKCHLTFRKMPVVD